MRSRHMLVIVVLVVLVVFVLAPARSWAGETSGEVGFFRGELRAGLNSSAISARGHSSALGVGVEGTLALRFRETIHLLCEAKYALRDSDLTGEGCDLPGYTGQPGYYEFGHVGAGVAVRWESLARGTTHVYALAGVDILFIATAEYREHDDGDSQSIDVADETLSPSLGFMVGGGVVWNANRSWSPLLELRYSRTLDGVFSEYPGALSSVSVMAGVRI